jgi:GNAT superfamily N-acetyltransferase
MDVALRPATGEDRPFLERVYASSRDAELRAVDWPDETKAAFLRQQFEAQSRHYATAYFDAAFSIILLEGEPVGRLIVHRGAREIRVVDIAVLAEHRGKGIGARLFNALIAEAAGASLPLSVHVEAYNPALGWYERMGFRRAGETGPYIYMVLNGEERDAG